MNDIRSGGQIGEWRTVALDLKIHKVQCCLGSTVPRGTNFFELI